MKVFVVVTPYFERSYILPVQQAAQMDNDTRNRRNLFQVSTTPANNRGSDWTAPKAVSMAVNTVISMMPTHLSSCFSRYMWEDVDFLEYAKLSVFTKHEATFRNFALLLKDRKQDCLRKHGRKCPNCEFPL
jgi:hypothetical protein